MTQCPYCNDLLGPGDFLPGKGAVCPRCGNQVAAAGLTRTATSPSPQPGPPRPPPLFPELSGRGGARAPVSKPVEDVDEPEPPASFIPGLRHLDGGTLGAFLVGSIAVLLASAPYLSVLTKPLAVLGLLLGLGAGVVPALLGKRKVWLPVAASALSLVVVLFVGSWPRPAPPPPPPRVTIALREGGMVAHQPANDADWVEASAQAVKLHDFRAQVMAARVGGVELEYQGKKAVTADRYLVIRLRVSYEGVVFRQIPYEPWADLPGSPSKHEPTLTDNLNHTYAQKNFGPGRKVVGRTEKYHLTPGRMVDEVLVFPVPPAKVDYLRLQLPASAFGGEGEFRFQIPRSMLVNSNDAAVPRGPAPGNSLIPRGAS